MYAVESRVYTSHSTRQEQYSIRARRKGNLVLEWRNKCYRVHCAKVQGKQIGGVEFDVVGDLANNRFKFAETGIEPVFLSTATQRVSFTPLCNIIKATANELSNTCLTLPILKDFSHYAKYYVLA